MNWRSGCRRGFCEGQARVFLKIFNYFLLEKQARKEILKIEIGGKRRQTFNLDRFDPLKVSLRNFYYTVLIR